MISRLIFTMIFLTASSAWAEKKCAAGNLNDLKSQGVVANLDLLLTNQKLAPDQEYNWGLSGNKRFTLRVQPTAPHQLEIYIEQAKNFFPLKSMCADGTNTWLFADVPHGLTTAKVQVIIANRDGQHFAEAFVNRSSVGVAQVGKLTAGPIRAPVVATTPNGRH